MDAEDLHGTGCFDWAADELDLKLFTTGTTLQTLCSFLDTTSENVNVEYDSETGSIKIISESFDHSIEVRRARTLLILIIILINALAFTY